MTKKERNLWIVLVLLIFAVLALMATAIEAQTPTPTPCAGCPDPSSFSCQAWPQVCYDCWSGCGQPIATHTPTPTATPVITPTPTPRPTAAGPPCTITPTTAGMVYLIAYWQHEHEGEKCKRWTYETFAEPIPAGWTAYPDDRTEGIPVGYQWYDAVDGRLLKSCGDTSMEYPCPGIFSDGFESGDTSKWSGG